MVDQNKEKTGYAKHHTSCCIDSERLQFGIMSSIAEAWVDYTRASEAAVETWQQELERRSALQQGLLLRFILQQQTIIASASNQKVQIDNSNKQELNKLRHEKKLLESKISQQTSEIETLKKKTSSQLALQKDNMSLKTQISKLNSHINDAKNKVNRNKQQFLTQKAVLESKLENAKKNLKSLRDQKGTSSKPLGNPMSPAKSQVISKVVNRPQMSNFSVSPFLSKTMRPSSPTKIETPHLMPLMESSTPHHNQAKPKLQSTPGAAHSPSKVAFNTRPGSALKSILSPMKRTVEETTTLKNRKAASLFDNDDIDDDDFFSNTINKVKTDAISNHNKDMDGSLLVDGKKDGKNNATIIKKPTKRKIGSKSIVEVDDEDIQNNIFSPLKRVKLLDKLGGISPLKQRNKERNLFKV